MKNKHHVQPSFEVSQDLSRYCCGYDTAGAEVRVQYVRTSLLRTPGCSEIPLTLSILFGNFQGLENRRGKTFLQKGEENDRNNNGQALSVLTCPSYTHRNTYKLYSTLSRAHQKAIYRIVVSAVCRQCFIDTANDYSYHLALRLQQQLLSCKINHPISL